MKTTQAGTGLNGRRLAEGKYTNGSEFRVLATVGVYNDFSLEFARKQISPVSFRRRTEMQNVKMAGTCAEPAKMSQIGGGRYFFSERMYLTKASIWSLVNLPS